MKKGLFFISVLCMSVMLVSSCGKKDEPVEEPVSVVEETPEVALYTVVFEDGEGKELARVEGVEEGSSVAAPVDPVRDGYVFAGWDKDFSKVTEDLVVKALWEKEILVISADTSDDVDENGELKHPLLRVEVRKTDGSSFSKDDAITVAYDTEEELAKMMEVINGEEDDLASVLAFHIDGLEPKEKEDYYEITILSEDLRTLDGAVLYTGDGKNFTKFDYDLDLIEREETEDTVSSSSAG